MSRIGLKTINIPAGVTVSDENGVLIVKGPKGTLNVALLKGISYKVEGTVLSFARENDTKQIKQNHGTVRANANNAVIGVSEGFKRNLEIIGIGYRAAMRGNDIVLNMGYSHEVVITPEEGCKITVTDTTKIAVEGIDRQKVGQTAARIRAVREPEPYKGKGILYVGEHILRKEGKRAGAGK